MQIQRLIKIMKQLTEDFASKQYSQRINEFITVISQPQNKANISILQGIGEKVLTELNFIENTSYYEELNETLDTLSTPHLDNKELISEFNKIHNSSDTTAAVYHQKLNQLLQDFKKNFTAVNAIATKFTTDFGAFDSDKSKDEFEYTNEEQAVIGLHLINKSSYQMLGNFTELMNDWDTALYLYSRCANVDTDNLKPRVSTFRNGSVWAELIVAIGVASDIISIYNAGIATLQLFKDFKEFLAARQEGLQMSAFDKFEEGLDGMKKDIIQAIQNEAKSCLEKHEGSQSVEVGANAISNVVYGNIINGNNITLIDSQKPNKALEKENKKLREQVRKLEIDQELLDEIKLLVDSKLPEKDYLEIDKKVKKKK
jgi:hypothetical protein